MSAIEEKYGKNLTLQQLKMQPQKTHRVEKRLENNFWFTQSPIQRCHSLINYLFGVCPSKSLCCTSERAGGKRDRKRTFHVYHRRLPVSGLDTRSGHWCCSLEEAPLCWGSKKALAVTRAALLIEGSLSRFRCRSSQAPSGWKALLLTKESSRAGVPNDPTPEFRPI